MGFIDNFIDTIRPGTTGRVKQAEVLEQLFAGAMGVQPRQWYRLVSQAGTVTGLSYVCNCHTEYRFFGVFEYLRTQRCPCGTEINLLKFLKLPPDIPAKDVEQHLQHLSVRPNGQVPKQQAFDTWEGSAGAVTWDGDQGAEDRSDINKGLW